MSADRAFSGNDRSAARWYAKGADWWSDHYLAGVDQTVEFFGGDGISLKDAVVLDLGCGDGIFALGLSRRTGAAQVFAVDLVDIDSKFLEEVAADNGIDIREGPTPEFLTSRENVIPLPDQAVDFVITWSVFEHVADPQALLREIRRVLRPSGLLFVQIWPLFYSEHGSHLWPFFDSPFVQLRLGDDQVRSALGATLDPETADAMFDLYRSCNRITVDELQRALLGAGFRISKVELLHNALHVPAELQDVPLSKLGITGIKLVAYVPD